MVVALKLVLVVAIVIVQVQNEQKMKMLGYVAGIKERKIGGHDDWVESVFNFCLDCRYCFFITKDFNIPPPFFLLD